MSNDISRTTSVPRVPRTQFKKTEASGPAATPSTEGVKEQSDVAEISKTQEAKKPSTVSLNVSFRLPAATIAASGGLANLTAAFVLDEEVDKMTRTWKPEGSEGKVIGTADVVSAQANVAEQGQQTRYIGVAVDEQFIAKAEQNQPLYFDVDGQEQTPKSVTQAVAGLGELKGQDAEIHLHLDVPEEILEKAGGATLALIPSDELQADGRWKPGQDSQALAPELYTVNLSNKPEDGTGVAHMAMRGTPEQSREVGLDEAEPKAHQALITKNFNRYVEATENEPLSRGKLEEMGYTPESAVETLKSYADTVQANPHGLPADWVANPENRKTKALHEFVFAAGTVAAARKEHGHLAVESAKVAFARGQETSDSEDLSPELYAGLKPHLEVVMGKGDPFSKWSGVKAAGDRTTMHTLQGLSSLLTPPEHAARQRLGLQPLGGNLLLLGAAHTRAAAMQQIQKRSQPDGQHSNPILRMGVSPENLTLGDLKRQSDFILEEFGAKAGKGPLSRLWDWSRTSASNLASGLTGQVAIPYQNPDRVVEAEKQVNKAITEAIAKADEGDQALTQWLRGEVLPNYPKPYG